MNCPQCNNDAVWINYGPTVGEGYYCRECKDEVDHPSNTYGISGTQLKRITQVKLEPKLDIDGFIHINQPLTLQLNSQPSSPQMFYNGQDIQCIRISCHTCGNKIAGTSVLNLVPGQYLYCKISYSYFIRGNFYKFVRIDLDTIIMEHNGLHQTPVLISVPACTFQV